MPYGAVRDAEMSLPRLKLLLPCSFPLAWLGASLSVTHLVATAGETRIPLGQDAFHPQEEGALNLILWERGAERGAGHEPGGGATRSLPWLIGDKPQAKGDGPKCHPHVAAYPGQSESGRADGP